MTDQEVAVDLVCEGHKVSKRLRALLPDISFLYYNDRACQAEICRRLKTSPAMIERVTHGGLGEAYEELMGGDALPVEHKPSVGSHRSTRGRW